jgi:hypothetical protein
VVHDEILGLDIHRSWINTLRRVKGIHVLQSQSIRPRPLLTDTHNLWGKDVNHRFVVSKAEGSYADGTGAWPTG